MILKASTRGGSKQLAQHLLSNENDHVVVHSVDGCMSEDVEGALQEMYAISRGTKAKKFMFSLSLNPPQHETVSTTDFEDAIGKVENKLKLAEQPKIIVFHEKEGRRHCHCVWSLIDSDKMKKIELNYFKKDVNTVAKDLYIQHGWDMPQGFLGQEYSNSYNFNLKEWQQAKKHNLNAKQIKAKLQTCWKTSDDKKSFSRALSECGFLLAKGDKKNVHVAVSWHGEVYSLGRSLNVKKKELVQRLGEPENLPTVAASKLILSQQHSEVYQRLQKELIKRQQAEGNPLQQRKAELIKRQREERLSLKEKQALQQQTMREQHQAQYRKGLSALWDKLVGKNRKMRLKHEQAFEESKAQDRKEKEALIKEQLAERQVLQKQLKVLKSRHQSEALALQADFMKDRQGQENTLQQSFTRSVAKSKWIDLEQIRSDRSPDMEM